MIYESPFYISLLCTQFLIFTYHYMRAHFKIKGHFACETQQKLMLTRKVSLDQLKANVITDSRAITC